MERPSIAPEGVELWESSDQGCDIMLRHLEAARDVARSAQSYTANAQKILQGKHKKMNILPKQVSCKESHKIHLCALFFRVSVR